MGLRISASALTSLPPYLSTTPTAALHPHPETKEKWDEHKGALWNLPDSLPHSLTPTKPAERSDSLQCYLSLVD